MSSHIYHGLWINWSHGAILGATLTLGQRDGGLLTAFIATFVTIAGAQLWKIVAYLFHQIKSNAKAQDGLHYQQQIILRNEATPGGAAWKFLKQSWFWRSKASHAFWRTLPLAIFSVLFVGLFGVLAVFSSEISKAPGSARLIVGDQCGYWRLNSSDEQDALLVKVRGDTASAALYAQQCYGGHYDSLQCSRYPVSSIPWTSNQNATCPFESGTCYYGDTAAFQITSKMMDSHYDLGINAPNGERMQYQKITTCAPLYTRPFSQLVNVSSDAELGWDGDLVVLYDYGPMKNISLPGSVVSNFTVQYNTHTPLDQIGYTLSSLSSTPVPKTKPYGWQPISALYRTDADLSIVFISANSLRYSTPNADPVFGANQLTPNSNPPFWTFDHYVSVIGCAEQHRICNPTNGACTDALDEMGVLEAAIGKLSLTAVQEETVARFGFALSFTSVNYATWSRMQNALLAQTTVFQLEQTALPYNQWMLEVGSWFDEGLARMQHMVQEYALGPTYVSPGSYVWQPGNAISKSMCFSQLINDSSDSISFSVLGMIILFAVGGAIIIASFGIDVFVGYLQAKFNTGLHARSAWLEDDKLQIQKMLFQERGKGTWTSNIEDFPTTLEKSKFDGASVAASVDSKEGRKGDYTRVSVTEQPYAYT